jgi:hypothetical protein
VRLAASFAGAAANCVETSGELPTPLARRLRLARPLFFAITDQYLRKRGNADIVVMQRQVVNWAARPGPVIFTPEPGIRTGLEACS